MTNFNVTTATIAELLAFFNANTGGNPVKKFADRKTAERRCQALADEMVSEEYDPNLLTGFQARELEGEDLADEAGIDCAPTNEENGEGLFKSEAELNIDSHSSGHQFDLPETGLLMCAKCGATSDITSGRVVNRAGRQVIVDEDAFMCHCCGNEWGTKDSGAKVSHKVGPRPAMVASLKIDRHIVDLLTGIVYDNACRVWKDGLVSAAQGDRLSAELYGAFKTTGKRDHVCHVNGHNFRLAYL